ncbi:MAG: hypothetical protein VX589_05260 [Myxococcota bacterium]|nr:hypothetical protein [Myxococcota bacterium]
MDDALLNLRPVSASDREAVRQILAVPELSRVQILSGLRSLHPVAWSDALKTFGIRLGTDLFGALELKRDDEEPDTWELAIVLLEHKRSYDGARSAVAALHYAFTALGASTVWFWSPEAKTAVHTFAEEMKFTPLNWMPVPGGGRARVYEMQIERWLNPPPPIVEVFLERPVTISDTHRCWRGEGDAFTEVDRTSSR